MPSIPSPTTLDPLGYLGLVSILFGFYLILAGTEIVHLDAIKVTPGPRTWVVGIVLALVGLGFLFRPLSSSPSPSSTSAAVLAATPTSMPVESVPTPTPAPTATSPLPTLTPSPTIPPRQATEIVVGLQGTNTPEPEPTSISTSPSGLHLGYIDRDRHCPLITHIVRVILEQEYDYEVTSTSYPSADQLYEALLSPAINITLCYVDPMDRSTYLLPNVGAFQIIGDGYLETDNEKMIVMTSSGGFAILNTELCIHNFLRRFELSRSQFNEFQAYLDQTSNNMTAAAQNWVAEHRSEVEDWKPSNCSP